MKEKKKAKFQSKNVLLILGIIYTLITILAIISYLSQMSSISSTPITFWGVLGTIWFQIVIIILFGISYLLYTKKPIIGMLLEVIMGLAMLVYIIISVALMGIDIFALIIELVYPLILVFHGLKEFKKLNKKQNRQK